MEGFLAFINEHRLFNKTDQLLVAVSGGIDSMVLTDLLHQHGFSFGIAHVNFALRGAESEADAVFVENRARHYGVPFHLTRFETEAEATKRGESVQVTARQLRYIWFEQVRQAHGYVAIATAHHADDVLETMLLNLTRGTGLTGLTGIPIQTEQAVVRPLWFASREQIEAYARERDLPWREDASNSTDKYARNRIRHQVVPVLKTINPGLLGHLPRTAGYLRSADAIVQEAMATSWAAVARLQPMGIEINLAAVRDLSEPLFRLGEWLQPYGFSAQALTQFWQSVDAEGDKSVKNGQRIQSSTHQLMHERGAIWLIPRESPPPAPMLIANWPEQRIDVPGAGYVTAERFDRRAWDGELNMPPTVALFDAAQLLLPWVFRRWQPGDRFRPLGLSGTQLVSDLLTNAKIPAPQRSSVWVLEVGGEVIWVVGVRIAHRSRITETTEQIVRLSLTPIT
ncbi:tRNA lysidine(34) synthetase TilS [Fibrella sp. WM1]|uniref:tRNA lysidine(34) synthetase TilS n=1 Tax=Fibrella musci TaxID=3242485 RepID=UPI00352171D9